MADITIHGGDEENIFDGSELDELYFGNGGNDSLSGNDGDDELHGGAGFDTLRGGEGGDTLYGSLDDDLIIGDAGDDHLSGHEGNDSVLGGEGQDSLAGFEGNDTLRGGLGNDYLNGGTENDFLGGGAGNDTLDGGDGNDELHGRLDNDSLVGGNGDDLIFGEQGDDYVNAGIGNDTVIGGIGNDSLYGMDGNDSIKGYAGADILNGGNGDDYLHGNQDNDSILGGNGNDLIYGGNDNDVINGGADNDTIIGGNDNGTLHVTVTKIEPDAPVVSIAARDTAGLLVGDGMLDFGLSVSGKKYTLDITETGVAGGRFAGEVDFIRNQGSESITINLGVEVKKGTFSVDKFYKNEAAGLGEKLKVTAFDADGNETGSSIFAANNANGKATFNISGLGTFESLKFEAVDNGIALGKTDNSDFLLTTLTFELAGTAKTVKTVDSFTVGDKMAGGTGMDLFIFGNGTGRGVDLITDFTIGEDKLSLTNVVGSFEKLMANNAVDHGGNALFYFGNHGVELQGVALASLSESDFTF